ncbi:hypothetical protein K491DRAFT_778180 [Lophiostoma macrostomum CBS 122681]|uniref:Hydrophobin n=1 Tax=Lophiostoma macrostomum CBS 122681 TaxID=1314788 RepID=A0A6A6T983_9PLEO|nr:hypothetical protein K491DRAFT_778180 [Lophiostoma macrostomum CBS 122681]
MHALTLLSFTLITSTSILAQTNNGTENPCDSDGVHLYCCPYIESSDFSPCQNRTLALQNTLKDCLPEQIGHDFDTGYACCIPDDRNSTDWSCIATKDIPTVIANGTDYVDMVYVMPPVRAIPGL